MSDNTIWWWVGIIILITITFVSYAFKKIRSLRREMAILKAEDLIFKMRSVYTHPKELFGLFDELMMLVGRYSLSASESELPSFLYLATEIHEIYVRKIGAGSCAAKFYQRWIHDQHGEH